MYTDQRTLLFFLAQSLALHSFVAGVSLGDSLAEREASCAAITLTNTQAMLKNRTVDMTERTIIAGAREFGRT